MKKIIIVRLQKTKGNHTSRTKDDFIQTSDLWQNMRNQGGKNPIEETKQIQLSYNTNEICPNKELLLNIAFKLKKAETLLPAGHIVAKNQLAIRPYQAPKLDIQNRQRSNLATIIPTIKDNDN